jgi:hypothetical protein
VQSYQPEVAGQDLGDPRPKGAGTAALVSVVRRQCDTRRRANVVGPAAPGVALALWGRRGCWRRKGRPEAPAAGVLRWRMQPGGEDNGRQPESVQRGANGERRGGGESRRDGRTGVGGRTAGRIGRMEDWAVDLGR